MPTRSYSGSTSVSVRSNSSVVSKLSLALKQRSKNGPAACASACGAIIPALAHEASLPRRPFSKTVTASPSRASRHAIELPITPPPIITTRFFTLFALSEDEAGSQPAELVKLSLNQKQHLRNSLISRGTLVTSPG